MRIAFGGIHTECSTYNPVLATADQFDVLDTPGMATTPYFSFLGDYPAEFIPTIHARAVPGGPVARTAYEGFKAEFLARLTAALPLDGLYLAMHGAMFVEGMEDAEADWIGAARDIVGPDVPIAASYDLHGNLSQSIIDKIDIYSTYRTAPHIDVEQTQRRAVSMLVETLDTGVAPLLCWVPVPVLLPGERTSTLDEPARSFYAAIPAMEASDSIWDASFNVGYVWADEPRATAAAIVTGTDRDAMSRAATELAGRYWNLRGQFEFGCETGPVADLVPRAIESGTRPVVLADSGDNPTGGGVGDRADLLEALIAHGARDTIVAGIADAPAVGKCFEAGEGASLELTVGASLDAEGSDPLRTTAEIVRLAKGDGPGRRQAVVRIGGPDGIDLVLAERRRPYHDLEDFSTLGLDPREAAIVVVKSGYLSPDLAAIANPNLMALSEGVVNQDIERLERRRMSRPTWPFYTDAGFTPEVRWSARSVGR